MRAVSLRYGGGFLLCILRPMPRYALARPPQTPTELWWAVYGMWGIKIPTQRVCPHHRAPFEAFANAYFAIDPVSVWWASRGFGGKSFLLSVLALSEATWLGANISLLGGSGAQSLNVLEHCNSLWSAPHAPRALLHKANKFGSVLNNDASIRALMASQGSVRGPHPQRLRLDEIDEMELEILDASLGQPMMKNGVDTQTVMSSTWQYPDRTMRAIMNRAKENDWPVYSWCYRETSNEIDGWLLPQQVRRKKMEIPKAMWDSEYELQEPNVEGRAIDPELVELCFDKGLGSFTGEHPVRIEEPHPAESYITGVDWAKQKDFTVVATFKIKADGSWVCVAWQQYRKLTWTLAVARAYVQWNEYGGELIHDSTGLGTVVDDILRDHCRNRQEEKRITSFTMSRASNNVIFMDYIAAIEQTKVVYPMIDFAYDEHRYTTLEDLFTSKGHPADSFVAGALAWSGRKTKLGKIAAAISTPKTSGWDLSVG